jgi:hypothetical protein
MEGRKRSGIGVSQDKGNPRKELERFKERLAGSLEKPSLVQEVLTIFHDAPDKLSDAELGGLRMTRDSGFVELDALVLELYGDAYGVGNRVREILEEGFTDLSITERARLIRQLFGKFEKPVIMAHGVDENLSLTQALSQLRDELVWTRQSSLPSLRVRIVDKTRKARSTTYGVTKATYPTRFPPHEPIGIGSYQPQLEFGQIEHNYEIGFKKVVLESHAKFYSRVAAYVLVAAALVGGTIWGISYLADSGQNQQEKVEPK